MTTTTTADPYASVRESPGFADLAAFQAGETDTFPQTGWEKAEIAEQCESGRCWTVYGAADETKRVSPYAEHKPQEG